MPKNHTPKAIFRTHLEINRKSLQINLVTKGIFWVLRIKLNQKLKQQQQPHVVMDDFAEFSTLSQTPYTHFNLPRSNFLGSAHYSCFFALHNNHEDESNLYKKADWARESRQFNLVLIP